MNKKTFIISLAVIIIIIILVILGLRSCKPRTKAPENIPAQETETQTINERNNFINANIEFTCEILKNPSLKDDKAATEAKVKEIFAKHALPVDDNLAMEALLIKYSNDTEATNIIRENSKPCAENGEPIFLK